MRNGSIISSDMPKGATLAAWAQRLMPTVAPRTPSPVKKAWKGTLLRTIINMSRVFVVGKDPFLPKNNGAYSQLQACLIAPSARNT